MGDVYHLNAVVPAQVQKVIKDLKRTVGTTRMEAALYVGLMYLASSKKVQEDLRKYSQRRALVTHAEDLILENQSAKKAKV